MSNLSEITDLLLSNFDGAIALNSISKVSKVHSEGFNNDLSVNADENDLPVASCDYNQNSQNMVVAKVTTGDGETILVFRELLYVTDWSHSGQMPWEGKRWGNLDRTIEQFKVGTSLNFIRENRGVILFSDAQDGIDLMDC